MEVRVWPPLGGTRSCALPNISARMARWEKDGNARERIPPKMNV